MARRLLRLSLLLLVTVYAVSHFWTGWLDRLPAPWQDLATVVLLGLVVLDVAAFASPRVARFLDGRDD